MQTPDVLNQVADRIQRAEHQARQVLDETAALKTLFRLLSPEADGIADQVFALTPVVQDEDGGS